MRTGEATTGHDVDLLLDFLNTVDLEKHTDLLDDAHGWQSWLAARGLSDTDATRVRAVRDGLRAAAAGEPASLDGFAVPVEVVGGVPRLVGVEVTGAVLAAAVRLAALGEWERVKICPADECRWAFFDRSRNRSRTWCSMRVCGNREKARAWRERTRSE
ncbi:CGNR zinc finger domain-containing protein [Actinokineospora sp. PR83]|uniref:CGNR zinc finger domain-containing protein n=1 Tax=Actinokineospora sp. PR83 TaxID=2884908 RepID=UPI0027DF3940|nr:CGNR zinc finger domain-containing protein [Actinokineospora sp. PR83]MCG8914219.1 CGNR zinc finger domain-containing protein [Actinokineospora sp. PR83]